MGGSTYELFTIKNKDMGKRHSRRFNVFLNAVLISDDVSYAGFIGNLSETGVYMRIKSANAKIDFKPGTKIEVKLELLFEETLNLNCRLVWAYELPLDFSAGKSAYNMGIEIIDLNLTYKKFYKYLTRGILEYYKD